ncbi:MAG: YicC family protein [Deltaproteobacteria bacterium]|nr:YicC family protein [Deltaproteobacteria bacterium]
MLRSMTGFGSARGEDHQRAYSVEVKSVNHRHCDVRVHAPPSWSGLTAELESLVRAEVARGRVDLSLEARTLPGRNVAAVVDLDRARAVYEAGRLLGQELEIDSSMSLEMIMAAPGVLLTSDRAGEPDEVRAKVVMLTREAVAKLAEMRTREGRAIEADLRRRLLAVRRMVEDIRAALPGVVAERRSRLEARLCELLAPGAIDPTRLAQEVAILADRADTAEELLRLDSHSDQFATMMNHEDAVGRRLDFLLQEMHREANTLGAKVMSAALAHVVVELKSELERIREQVQNVE